MQSQRAWRNGAPTPMSNTALLKGQRITSPEGAGEVIEITGDKVVVKLDNGETKTFVADEITDDSNAG